MAIVFICERCNGKVEKHSAGLFDFKTYRWGMLNTFHYGRKDYELCGKCVADFNKFMSAYANEDTGDKKGE